MSVIYCLVVVQQDHIAKKRLLSFEGLQVLISTGHHLVRCGRQRRPQHFRKRAPPVGQSISSESSCTDRKPGLQPRSYADVLTPSTHSTPGASVFPYAKRVTNAEVRRVTQCPPVSDSDRMQDCHNALFRPCCTSAIIVPYVLQYRSYQQQPGSDSVKDPERPGPEWLLMMSSRRTSEFTLHDERQRTVKGGVASQWHSYAPEKSMLKRR